MTAEAGAPKAMTIDDLAKRLQVSKSFRDKLAQAGKASGQSVGRLWRFRRPVIDVWLRRTTQSQSRMR